MIHERTAGPSQSTASNPNCWQPGFVAMLPLIERYARYRLSKAA